MRRSDIGSFGPQWGLGLLPFLLKPFLHMSADLNIMKMVQANLERLFRQATKILCVVACLVVCLSTGHHPMSKITSKSRRATPWDHSAERTASQNFIRNETKKHYKQRHQKLRDTNEATLINTVQVTKCPYCGSERIKKNA